MPTLFFVAIFLEFLVSAEFNPGTALGLFAGKTVALKVIRAMQYVRT
jgi:hypothetical protein